MNVQQLRSTDDLQGQAAFGMANLRKEKTGLPFIVFISQKDGAQHDVRVKISPAPKVRIDQMSYYSLQPYRFAISIKLNSSEEALLKTWGSLNLKNLIDYWNGDIEYTKDAIGRLQAV